MSLSEKAKSNLEQLGKNEYPGRGIIIGMTPDGENLVQIYWIMGRSKNSQNRIFKEKEGIVSTEAFDIADLEDPSLIIYNCICKFNEHHIVANGDQSDTVMEYLERGLTFQEGLETREYEPDDPNCTPRITGKIDREKGEYELSILKSIDNLTGMHSKNFYKYPQFLKGYGHLIHTYENNGNPLPSFHGEPPVVSIKNDQEENLNYFWDLVNDEYKVSMLVKYINVSTKEEKIIIKNKLS
ncbi:MAG: IMP cyclohydrolase [Spirochaetales bacterium]|nr:IMP cyclohydrolase [Spirochaetales bacterium]